MSRGVLIVIGKSGGIGEHGIGAAKSGSLIVHHLDESIHRTADMLGNLQSDVIGGSNHDGVETLLHRKHLVYLGGDAGAAVCDTGNAGGSHGDFICKLCILKGQQAGHDLHRTSGKENFVGILGIEDGIGSVLHDDSCLRRDVGSLRPAGNAVGRNAAGGISSRISCLCGFLSRYGNLKEKRSCKSKCENS